jgi:hypothetical protein
MSVTANGVTALPAARILELAEKLAVAVLFPLVATNAGHNSAVSTYIRGGKPLMAMWTRGANGKAVANRTHESHRRAIYGPSVFLYRCSNNVIFAFHGFLAAMSSTHASRKMIRSALVSMARAASMSSSI